MFRSIMAAMATVVLLLQFGGTAAAAHGNGTLERRQVTAGRLVRNYLLYVPDTSASFTGERPLIVVLHGGGGTARGIAREAGRTLHALADRDGFYIAYPDAIDRIWDFGAGDVSEALDERVDDRAFFGALLDALLRELPIDARRVFATGISRGGQASYFLACNFPGRIRAIAAVAMPLPAFMIDMCHDSPPLGVAILNGTDDPLVPYDGGEITVGRKRRGMVISTDATAAFWRERNGCAGGADATLAIDPVNDHTRVRQSVWRDCRAPVVLYRIEGGGHTWPSGRQYLPRFLVGRVSRDIDAGAEIWTFFRGFD